MNGIEAHKRLLNNPIFRRKLLADFRPTFCFDKNEKNFPCKPDEYLRNVVEVKRDEYLNIVKRQGRGLTPIEQKELDIINSYFWKNGKFNTDYLSELINNAEFKDALKNVPDFQIFDEKKYGYRTGSRINLSGTRPYSSAPLSASIIPTNDGFFIQYEYSYAVSNCIPSLGWIRNLLPYKVIALVPDKYKEIPNIAFHYGDSEKAGIYVKMEDDQLKFGSLQTWAHGRRYAERIYAKDCTFGQDGHVKVFVGEGTHPSYGFNFPGRNMALDLVGNGFELKAEDIIDLSPDVMTAFWAKLDGKPVENPLLSELTDHVPGVFALSDNFADSNPLAHCDIDSERKLDEEMKGHTSYHPIGDPFSNAAAAIKTFFKRLFGVKPKPKYEPKSFPVKSTGSSSDFIIDTDKEHAQQFTSTRQLVLTHTFKPVESSQTIAVDCKSHSVNAAVKDAKTLARPGSS